MSSVPSDPRSDVIQSGLEDKKSDPFDCSMYRKELPNQDELVIVKVKSIEDFGAFVSLLEYNHIEGMIMSSEVSRKRIRSIHKHLRIGKQDVMQVLRVDKEKGKCALLSFIVLCDFRP